MLKWQQIQPIINILLLTLALFGISYLSNQQTSKKAAGSKQISTSNEFQPHKVRDCENCIDIRELGIPLNDRTDIGKYLDYGLAQKLKKLNEINSTWHVSEAYPPTVRHLSPCHNAGTCADLTFKSNANLNRQTLSKLCADISSIGLNILNEYSQKYYYVGSACPKPQIFETTTGNNLHVY